MLSDILQNPKLFRHLVEELPFGIYIVDRDRIIRFWNQGAEHITGYLAHEVVGHLLEDVVQACDQQGNSFAGEERPVTVTLRERRSQQCIAFFLHKSGHRVPVDIHTIPIGQQGGAIEGVTVLFQEVFAYRDESSAPAMYGCLDAITRIPSRRLTQSLLNECMAGMQESDVGFGLLRIRILGLDDFRAKHGPQSVVPFLRTAARTLRHSLDSSNFLGCWDNNEFLAVLPSASPVTVAQTAEMLFNLVSQSEISWWGDRFLVKSEVSYTVATQGNELETLLREMKPAHSSGAVIEIASRTSTVSPKAPAAAVNYSARTQG